MNNLLVVGGTGRMGGAVIRHMLGTVPGLTVSAIVRDPASVRARALVAAGAHVVPMDGLDRALASADAVFANTDFFATGSVRAEYAQGVALLEAARRSGVDRFVWSSLDAAAALTGGAVPVPHYDSKAAVAAHINMMRADEVMRREDDGWYSAHVSILTTAPYMENLPHSLPPTPDGQGGLTFALALGDGRWPLIALDDIAWFARHMLTRWQSWGARDLAAAGDALTATSSPPRTGYGWWSTPSPAPPWRRGTPCR